ncbi:DUF2459 domain-containing protein [Burkholderia sp. WAC0059]|uniref:DUF2459 domain-containing protein n=1 Tax=Burkholderia sp. WAC0059 TaxID=2066022 RepID=UPI0015E0D241|nr:DUF2459 domain-containing protein [Burkholderia sp. WAC0059]
MPMEVTFLFRSVLLDIARLCPVALAFAACSSVPSRPSPGPVAVTVTVVERGWHTDVCVRDEDAGAWARSLALGLGFDGARFLCFGFGERQYVLTRTHDPLATVSALFPSEAAVLMTVLRATPAEAFGRSGVVDLGISRAGLIGLQAFLRRSIRIDAAGRAMQLGEGPYPGSVFFAATGTYDAFYTCNTWTADALRSAGLPVQGRVLFAGDLMYKVRQLPGVQMIPSVQAQQPAAP